MTKQTFLAALGAAFIVCAPAAFAAAPAGDGASEARLKADVEKLVSFGTRHTLSSPDDPKRGIGAARRFVESAFRKNAAACGGCLQVALPEKIYTGERIPAPGAKIINVLAIQPGMERPDEVVIVQGHIDSRVSDPLNATADAPGANDDGSGTALVLEAARRLSKNKYPTTIVYAVLSGEEQGLYGGRLLAEYAAAQGWTVKAVLNNDIVGNSQGSDALVDETHVRVFSEGPRADADDKSRAALRRFGGENDSPSRNLSRWIAGVAETATPDFAVRQIFRADRMGRGGDHLPFQEKGFPAVRFTVAVENYDHQHQDLRTENGIRYGDTVDAMDFPYLAKVTSLNIAALDRLARAPMPPVASVEGAVQTFTNVKWTPVPGAVAYKVWRRRTDARDWEVNPLRVEGASSSSLRLEGVRGDDWFFGVSAIGADGAEGPVSSALPGMGFEPAK